MKKILILLLFALTGMGFVRAAEHMADESKKTVQPLLNVYTDVTGPSIFLMVKGRFWTVADAQLLISKLMLFDDVKVREAALTDIKKFMALGDQKYHVPTPQGNKISALFGACSIPAHDMSDYADWYVFSTKIRSVLLTEDALAKISEHVDPWVIAPASKKFVTNRSLSQDELKAALVQKKAFDKTCFPFFYKSKSIFPFSGAAAWSFVKGVSGVCAAVYTADVVLRARAARDKRVAGELLNEAQRELVGANPLLNGPAIALYRLQSAEVDGHQIEYTNGEREIERYLVKHEIYEDRMPRILFQADQSSAEYESQADWGKKYDGTTPFFYPELNVPHNFRMSRYSYHSPEGTLDGKRRDVENALKITEDDVTFFADGQFWLPYQISALAMFAQRHENFFVLIPSYGKALFGADWKHDKKNNTEDVKNFLYLLKMLVPSVDGKDDAQGLGRRIVDEVSNVWDYQTDTSEMRVLQEMLPSDADASGAELQRILQWSWYGKISDKDQLKNKPTGLGEKKHLAVTYQEAYKLVCNILAQLACLGHGYGVFKPYTFDQVVGNDPCTLHDGRSKCMSELSRIFSAPKDFADPECRTEFKNARLGSIPLELVYGRGANSFGPTVSPQMFQFKKAPDVSDDGNLLRKDIKDPGFVQTQDLLNGYRDSIIAARAQGLCPYAYFVEDPSTALRGKVASGSGTGYAAAGPATAQSADTRRTGGSGAQAPYSGATAVRPVVLPGGGFRVTEHVALPILGIACDDDEMRQWFETPLVSLDGKPFVWLRFMSVTGGRITCDRLRMDGSVDGSIDVTPDIRMLVPREKNGWIVTGDVLRAEGCADYCFYPPAGDRDPHVHVCAALGIFASNGNMLRETAKRVENIINQDNWRSLNQVIREQKCLEFCDFRAFVPRNAALKRFLPGSDQSKIQARITKAQKEGWYPYPYLRVVKAPGGPVIGEDSDGE